MRSILVAVVLLSGCAVSVRPSSAVLVTICATPVGIIVALSDGSQQFVQLEQAAADKTLQEQLAALPEARRHRLELPICGVEP